MNLRARRSAWLMAIGLSVSVAVVAAQRQDAKGSSDHPRISRFADSVILRYNAGDFGQLVLPLSSMATSKGPTKDQTVEGRSRSLLYGIPTGHNSHEVFRTYEAALKKDGFTMLFACVGRAECGTGWLGYIQRVYNVVTGSADRESQRYLAAKRTAPEGDIYVMLYAFDQLGQQGTRALLNIVDVAPLKEGLVTITAAEMAKDIRAAGHVAVYGVLFDFDKADIKPESAAALREMAKLLQDQPKLNVAIVGHTDNVGTLEHNLSLSERRAQAVVQTLVAEHRIEAKRLIAKGVGPFAPVSSNQTEEGRAKNRRVELVER